MKKIVFTEEFCQPQNLFPFTLTRQIQDIRVGIFTIREKWELALDMPSFDKFEEDYKDLDRSVVLDQSIGDDIIYLIHGNILPSARLVKQVARLKPGQALSIPERESLVYCFSQKEILDAHKIRISDARTVEPEEDLRELFFPWDITAHNAWAIAEDLRWIRKRRKPARLSDTNQVIRGEDIFLEKGAVVEHCFLNAADGPIYIGKGATVMEGSMLRGPLAICEGATVKMGARIYGATTIGPYSVAGGEIKNSVLFGYSNKAHDGYLGDSVLGEWCNLGAGTSNSNLKNNASEVVVWTPGGLVAVGLKCGVFMGDYTRTAINTSINTGSVFGVCCNLFQPGLMPKYVPSFSWGSDGVQRYDLEKALTDIANWKSLKGGRITEAERIILKHIFDHY